jgi:putative ABC transport system ATP-binding protein
VSRSTFNPASSSPQPAVGSGKSTLMHILGCLDHPTSGQYFLDGRDVAKLNRNELADVRNNKIGSSFRVQSPVADVGDRQCRAAASLYEQVDEDGRAPQARHGRAHGRRLAERAHHHPNQLSGGQQQRVAIARALINQAVVILADEPTGNLDSRTSVESWASFSGLNAEQGITVLMITHEHDIAEYATRIVSFKRRPHPRRPAGRNGACGNGAALLAAAFYFRRNPCRPS